MKLACDKSVRTTDADGRLHVARSHISKAAVNGYLGREIPDGVEKLGLKPDQMYQLLRHPDELAKGAKSFNNIPVLNKHIPVSSAEPQKEFVIGSTGTDASFDGKYLDNSLVIWDDPAIAGIESKEFCELSCAYRYTAVMTPGEFDGVAYDGIMVDIIGNHVAVVDVGRAGPDVVIGDSHPTESMMKKKFSPRANVARAAVAAYLRPLMAADAALPDLRPAVDGVTAKTYAKDIPKIVKSVTKLTAGKLAQDANLDDLAELLETFKDDEASAMDADPEDTAMDEDAETEEEKKERMEKRARDKAAKDAASGAAAPEGPEGGAKKPDPVTRGAMDAALKKQADDLRAEFRAIETAKQEVRPIVGDIVVAMDSAEAVYKFALDKAEVDLADVPTSAYRAMVKMLKTEQAAPPPRIAQDQAGTAAAHKAVPALARIKID